VTTPPIVLKHCRDVASHLALSESAPATAELTGLITAVRPVGGIRFFTLRDVTGLVQLSASQQTFHHDSEWGEIEKIRIGDRVTASGSITRSKRGDPTILLVRVPTVREAILDSPFSGSAVDYPLVGTQMFVARLRNRASDFLRNEGYLEIEPKLISAEWRTEGVEPLELVYPGFGASAYLAPTPATQLIDALIATGSGAVFAQSRCFSTTYRDEKSSHESTIVAARAVGINAETLAKRVTACVAYTFGELQTLPEAGLFPAGEWKERLVDAPLSSDRAEDVKKPTLIMYRAPNIGRSKGGITIVQLCRLVWPPRRTIAEGSLELLDNGLALASMVFHIERMASLLRDVPFRNLRNLGVGAKVQ
jgi:hypothetical protein